MAVFYPARPLVDEVVAMPGLIVDDRDDAGCACAELILRGGIGVASSGEGFDVHGFGIRRSSDLVKFPVVGRKKRSHRAMCSNTRCFIFFINVTGQLQLLLKPRITLLLTRIIP